MLGTSAENQQHHQDRKVESELSAAACNANIERQVLV